MDRGFITLRGLLLCALVLCAGSQLSFGQRQPGTGTLEGEVADPAGAVVVRSVVTAVSASGTARSAPTDRTGRCVIPGMTPGAYEVKAAAAGFADSEKMHVELAQGQVRRSVPCDWPGEIESLPSFPRRKGTDGRSGSGERQSLYADRGR